MSTIKKYRFSKINVLKNFIYLNFVIDENSINLIKSSFKNKDLFAKFDSLIDLIHSLN